MQNRDFRATFLTLAIAASIGLAPLPAAGEQPSRDGVILVQGLGNPDLKKRADILIDGFKKEGGDATYGSIEAGTTPNGLVIKDIVLTSPDKKTMRIGAFEVRNYDWDNSKEPTFIDITIRQAAIPADAMDEEGQKGLKELGYESLTLNATLTYKFDAASKTIDVANFALEVVDGGELSFSIKLSGIDPADLKGLASEDKEKGGEQAVMGLLARLNFVGAKIVFKDKSIVQRLIRSEAKKKSQSEQAAKNAILADLAKERKEAKDAVSREFIDAAVKFINNPGEISIVANPQAPTNVMSAFMLVMSDPAQLKKMLGLTLLVR